MEPDVAAAGGFQGEAVVLDVVAAHQDGEAVVGAKLHGTQRGGRLLPAFLQAEVAARRQFLPQFPDFPDGGSAGQGIKDGVDIPQFFLATGDLFGENPFRCLGLTILLIILLGVLRRRQGGVEGYPRVAQSGS